MNCVKCVHVWMMTYGVPTESLTAAQSGTIVRDSARALRASCSNRPRIVALSGHMPTSSAQEAGSGIVPVGCECSLMTSENALPVVSLLPRQALQCPMRSEPIALATVSVRLRHEGA